MEQVEKMSIEGKHLQSKKYLFIVLLLVFGFGYLFGKLPKRSGEKSMTSSSGVSFSLEDSDDVSLFLSWSVLHGNGDSIRTNIVISREFGLPSLLTYDIGKRFGMSKIRYTELIGEFKKPISYLRPFNYKRLRDVQFIIPEGSMEDRINVD